MSVSDDGAGVAPSLNLVHSRDASAADGKMIGTDGYYADVTPSEDRSYQQSVTAAVAEITESRSGIEQAKGMLMLVYRIDGEAAFDLLKWRSQASNVKLRAIGEQIVKDFLGLAYSDVLPARSQYDQLLLTAHERIERAEGHGALGA